MSLLVEVWTWLYDLSGRSDWVFFVLGANLLSFVVFWGWNLFFLTADVFGFPGWMAQYKVQTDNPDELNPDKLRHAAKVVMFNMFFVGLPLTALIYPLQSYMGQTADPAAFPSSFQVFYHLICFVFWDEIAFYYLHRLFHWGPLYKLIHKKHHEWTAPISLITIYCHPIEMVVANIMPLLTGPIICGSHSFTVLVWHTIGFSSSIIVHSGYHLPYFPSPQYHDYHHFKFNQCYGVTGILDWLHGTDTQYRQTVHHQRHRTYISLKPIHKQYPNAQKTSMANGSHPSKPYKNGMKHTNGVTYRNG